MFNRLRLLSEAHGLVHKCPNSTWRHSDCYIEYIRKGKSDGELKKYISEMTNKQLERLISHHRGCPLNNK